MTTMRRTATTHVPVDTMRRTALVAGVFYLITFISSIPAVGLLRPILNDPDYIISAGADTQVLVGCLLDLVNAAACIGTAVALFPVVKRQSEAGALGFVTARMFEAAVIAIGVVSLLVVVTLRQAGASGADKGFTPTSPVLRGPSPASGPPEVAIDRPLSPSHASGVLS
jgi:hypothetical protein